MQRTKSRFAREIFNSGAVMVIALAFAASAFTARAEAMLKPTVTFTGAPTTAANGMTFTVTATTNDGTTATITATGACTVPTGSTGGTVTVTMTENKGTCTLTASWPATTTYVSAKATQKTTAVTGYIESDLYYFGTDLGVNGDDGMDPNFNGMVFDKAGNIYASTRHDVNNGDGAIVELSPIGNGIWNETLVYVFDRNSPGFSGYYPQGSLAMDSKGNIYGTTEYGGGAYNQDTGQYACGAAGGSYGCGTVFELSPNPNGGPWTATDLYDFAVNNANDGVAPRAGVTLGNTSATVLYGTTGGGGTVASGCSNGPGTIYELSYSKPTKTSPGSWHETILYSFPQDPLNQQGYCPAPNGWGPNTALLLNKGNLYGTTLSGGVNGSGEVGIGVLFELSPGTSGWTFNQLYVFCPIENDPTYTVCPEGGAPGAGTVAVDTQGNLYGTTVDVVSGGVNEPSTVWELPYSSATKSYANQVHVLYSSVYNSTTGMWAGGAGRWVVPYKNSLFTVWCSFVAEYDCSYTLLELTNSAKTGWQATAVYQFPPVGGTTLDGSGNQMIVDKNGNFYSLGNFEANGYIPYGGIFELSPLP